MNYLRQHPAISAILVNVILFSCVFAFGFPVFNSGDDAYLMYLLAGGFGEPPTELLHYNYGMHPYLGWIIKTAFTHFSGFNWYAFLLYALHFVSCTVILTHSIKKNQFIAGTGYYLLFFVMEVFFLLQPSFTNTALITAMAGSFLLYVGIEQTKSQKLILSGCLLLVIASLLRLHLLVPPLLLAAPFLFLAIERNKVRKLLLFLVFTAILITSFTLLQQQYYKQHIPGWEQEESYRQTIINHYNRPKKEKYPAEFRSQVHFLERGVLWDTTLLSRNTIAATTKAVQANSATSQSDFKQRLFWLMMESRLGILLILLLFIWKQSALTRQEKYAFAASACMFVALCAALMLFRKLPGYIVTGGMLQLLAFLMVSGKKQERYPVPIPALLTGASAVLLVWGVIRLSKLNERNKEQYTFWQCAYKQVASHPDQLFFVSDDKFPIDYFHVWHAPKKYPLPNLLTKDHFLNNTYHSAYKRFNITSPFHSKNVRFMGFLFPTDREYFEAASGKELLMVPMAKGDCIQVWELR